MARPDPQQKIPTWEQVAGTIRRALATGSPGEMSRAMADLWEAILHRVVRPSCPNEEQAWELTQEVILRIFQYAQGDRLHPEGLEALVKTIFFGSNDRPGVRDKARWQHHGDRRMVSLDTPLDGVDGRLLAEVLPGSEPDPAEALVAQGAEAKAPSAREQLLERLAEVRREAEAIRAERQRITCLCILRYVTERLGTLSPTADANELAVVILRWRAEWRVHPPLAAALAAHMKYKRTAPVLRRLLGTQDLWATCGFREPEGTRPDLEGRLEALRKESGWRLAREPANRKLVQAFCNWYAALLDEYERHNAGAVHTLPSPLARKAKKKQLDPELLRYLDLHLGSGNDPERRKNLVRQQFNRAWPWLVQWQLCEEGSDD